jgi:predicted TIM-barrel fold metal-dependent hydrolase
MPTQAGYRVIDTHVHVWPLDDAPGHRPAENAKVRAPKEAAPVEWLVQDMNKFGIDHCVLVQSSAFGWDNTYMVECLERYPGKFKAIGLVDPENPDNARDLERWMDRGLSGFRFHPLYYDKEPRGPWWVDAPVNDALWVAAESKGAIMQFHMWPKHAPALARMIERHPNVRVIVDHIGKPDVTEPEPYPSFDPVLALAKYPSVHAKIGDYQIASKQDYPWRDTWPFVRLLADRFRATRMMWGTGYPRTARIVPLAQALEYVRGLPCWGPGDLEQVLGETPRKLFGF